MNKKSLMYLRIFDQYGAILYEGLPANLPIPDEVIIKMSIHYFNDPQPCYIHRSAVIMRLAAELQQALEIAPLSPFESPWASCFSAFPDARRVEGFYP